MNTCQETSCKTCTVCGQIKPVALFSPRKEMNDGYRNECRACRSAAQSLRLKSNPHIRRMYNAKWRESENGRNWLSSPEQKLKRKETNKRPEIVAQRIEATKNWYAKDSRRKKAHKSVEYALSVGWIVKSNCIRCGNAKSVAHHEDYAKPLDVMWLCTACHHQRHVEIRKQTKLIASLEI